ncbi:hypothetical protein L7F22_051504 [Adiantum nelumboides]|nr:hypothetical protein [Adiantum nelumboides]
MAMVMRIAMQVVAIVQLLGCGGGGARAELSMDFYSESCPQLSLIAEEWFVSRFAQLEWAPAVLRLFFHDCMVQGCDASILLTKNVNGNTSVEKDARENIGLIGFDIIDGLKQVVEEECPQVVPCADLLALSAKIAVVMTLGPSWLVDFGRRDVVESLATSVTDHIPSPSSNVDQLMKIFSPLGLSKEDLVALSGAHTVGVSHCKGFANRIHHFSNDKDVDPSLDGEFARKLQEQCPLGDFKDVNPLDALTNTTFDNSYYILLLRGQDLFSLDDALIKDPSTLKMVTSLASSQEEFFETFVASMIKLSKVGVLEGIEGEVRKKLLVCQHLTTTPVYLMKLAKSVYCLNACCGILYTV